MAELVSSVAREKEGKKDYVAPVPVERSDDEEQTMRAATVRFPNSADGMSSSGISVRLVGDNACSIDTRSRRKLRSERRERRADRVALRANGSLLARRVRVCRDEVSGSPSCADSDGRWFTNFG